MRVQCKRSGKVLQHKRFVCWAHSPSSLGLLADLLSQRSALLDYIRKHDGVQDAKIGEIADMKFELRHVQAQIDAVNNGEELSPETAVSSTVEAKVGQLARKAISAKDPEDVITTCGQAVSGTNIGCWAVAAAPASEVGRKRLQVSFTFALPHAPLSTSTAEAVLIWGVSQDGASAWHEPPAGWSTDPPISWDIAHGAWGTHSTVVGMVPVEGGPVPAYGVLVELPWKASIRKYNGLAFKWSVRIGREKLWFGDTSGDNLSVRTSFAKFILSSSDETSDGSEPEESASGMNTSDKEDPSGAADLLAGLSQGQVVALRTTRSERPHPAPQTYAASIESAINPWMDASACSGQTVVAHDFVNGIGSEENKARRSLMHRYDIARQYVDRIQWSSGQDVQRIVDEQAISSLAKGPSMASDPPALHGLLEQAAASESQLMAVAVWLRFATARLLVWNHNYNVKPREISTSQDGVTSVVAKIWRTCPWARKVAVMVLATVGRGGDGNQGQRIRDEILSIQSRNGCKGGMMEQWHQKLHNNTSPDDVEICRALLAYLESGLDIQKYWDTLHAAGIDQQRLASFDRSITQEPSFSQQQVPQLVKDLQAYLVTLCAVHGGLDLQSGALPVLGYSQVKRKGRSVSVEPVVGFNTERLRKLVQSLLALQQPPVHDSKQGAVTGAVNAASNSQGSVKGSVNEEAGTDRGAVKEAASSGPRAQLQLAVQRMELSMEARVLCAEYLTASDGKHDRVRDVLHLDIVLTGTVRTIIEANLDCWLLLLKEAFYSQGSVSANDALLLLQMCNYATANYAHLQADNQHAVACSKELQQACTMLQDTKAPSERLVTWALQVLLANAQRLDKIITYDSSRTLEQMEATCSPLASALQVDQNAAKISIEDAVRAMPHAPLAQLLAPLEQALQKHLGGSMWRIVSPMQSGAVVGRLRFEQSLAAVQDHVLQEPTIIIAEQNIDVLCHAALRARATGAFLACCLDSDMLTDLSSRLSGQQVSLSMDGQDVVMSASDSAEMSTPAAHRTPPADAAQGLTTPPLDCPEWVVAQGGSREHVGSKCINLWRLSDRMSSRVPVPIALALPFGAWNRLLELPENRSVAAELGSGRVTGSQASDAVQQVSIPEDLHRACAHALSKLSDGQVAHTDTALHAIKRVWASKYGERACRACGFMNVPLSAIHMSVVLQPLINASMAFVSHTQDPRQLQDSGMNGSGRKYMYIEAVSGLGESLVGNVSGQPLSFTVDSSTLLQSLQDAVRSGRVPTADLKCLSTESVNGSNKQAPTSENLSEWLSKLPESEFEKAASCVSVETASSKSWMVVPGTSARGALHESADSNLKLHYGMIARSASNMEDLQSYSGAGVFDSFPVQGRVYCVTDFCKNWEGGFAQLELKMLLMALASLEVKACLDEGEMDVEGVIDAFGHVHVVQARPQV